MRKYYRVYKRAHFDFQKQALFFDRDANPDDLVEIFRYSFGAIMYAITDSKNLT